MSGRGAGWAPTAWYVIPSDRYLARWWNVLHLPYTLWHLSYVALGAALGEALRWDVLGWGLLAFFLGLGVAAHALDLLRGDPLALRLPESHLQVVGVASLLLAGLVGSLNIYWGDVDWWLGWLIVAGIVVALGYNLEWPGFHGDLQFALFWGVFPFATGYLAMGGGPVAMAILGGSFCFLASWAQRVLSFRARYLRRRVAKVSLSLWERTGSEGTASYLPDNPALWLLRPLDRALMLMSFAMPALAGGLLLWRWL
jgi:hypothetical protein